MTALLLTHGYDDLGRRIWASLANGIGSSLTCSGADRLTNLARDLAGTSNDIAIGMSYNPAAQITQRTLSNDTYSWADAYNVNRSYATNGLNQYTNISSSRTITPTCDARGNLTSAGGLSCGYTNRNQLQSVSSGAYFYYDAMERLDIDFGTGSCALLDNVGSNIDVELDCGTGATLRRYVYGTDNAPEVWYEGSGTSNKRWLLTDERGSVTAVTDGSANAMRINTYDEYGIPATNNLGRFQYTGQTWLPSIGMYYYRARIYSPTLGRFVQTDPIGYGDGPNWYNYVGGDPVNATDPSGLDRDPTCPSGVVCSTGHVIPLPEMPALNLGSSFGGPSYAPSPVPPCVPSSLAAVLGLSCEDMNQMLAKPALARRPSMTPACGRALTVADKHVCSHWPAFRQQQLDSSPSAWDGKSCFYPNN